MTCASRPIGVTSHTTPLSIRRGAGGEALCDLCMPEAFCGLEMCAKNLRELCALCERKNSMTCASSPIGVTSHTTPLSIRRGVGGEASANSVCRRRSVGSKRAWKSSVKSVSSVREKTPQRFFCVSSHNVGAFYFSQIYTEEQNSQRPTETLSQPISQNLIAIFGSNAL